MSPRKDVEKVLTDWGLNPAEYLIPEWPLDAPQPNARVALQSRGDALYTIELAVASPPSFDGRIPLSLTMAGKTETFIIRKRVAASLIAELARALADSA